MRQIFYWFSPTISYRVWQKATTPLWVKENVCKNAFILSNLTRADSPVLGGFEGFRHLTLALRKGVTFLLPLFKIHDYSNHVGETDVLKLLGS